jgi:hypothetical protein
MIFSEEAADEILRSAEGFLYFVYLLGKHTFVNAFGINARSDATTRRMCCCIEKIERAVFSLHRSCIQGLRKTENLEVQFIKNLPVI